MPYWTMGVDPMSDDEPNSRVMLAKRAGSPISGNKIRGLHRPSAEIGLSVPILLPFFSGNENFDNILVSLSHPPLSLPTHLQESLSPQPSVDD